MATYTDSKRSFVRLFGQSFAAVAAQAAVAAVANMAAAGAVAAVAAVAAVVAVAAMNSVDLELCPPTYIEVSN